MSNQSTKQSPLFAHDLGDILTPQHLDGASTINVLRLARALKVQGAESLDDVALRDAVILAIYNERVNARKSRWARLFGMAH